MPESFTIRFASTSDIDAIARHRCEMFSEMGLLPVHLHADLVSRTIEYLHRAIPTGEYIGWIASPVDDLGAIAAGAGVQRRRLLPHPVDAGGEIRVADGRQALVLNVFTEPRWRRQGLAAMLMNEVIEWARTANLDTLVLHASEDGRPLYEKLGFVRTSEMRYARPLQAPHA
jgi:GNAT superfamily N-acetyltransferase